MISAARGLPGLQAINPVLDRELRQRSRSKRSVVILTVFLLLLTGVMFLAYEANRSSVVFGDPLANLTRNTGRSMFEWVLATELLLLLFLVPGISAGSVAGERDRQTLVPLQVTLLGPVQIFVGKALASSGFLLLLLIGSAPILAVPFLVGGISLSQILLSLLTLLVIGFLLAIIGVGCSSIFRRTQTATFAAYAVVLALTFGSGVAVIVASVADGAIGDDPVQTRLFPLYANPFLAVADTAGDLDSGANGPFSPIKRVFRDSQFDRPLVTTFEEEAVFMEEQGVFIEGGIAFDPRTGQPIELEEPGGLPLWARSLSTIGVLAALFGVVGVRRLRAPSQELS